MFDGRRRFDLKLAFKRIDTVKTERGYAGPGGGLRRDLPADRGPADVEHDGQIRAGTHIEMTLAPVAGTRLLAPFRITIVNMLGNLVVQANRFEAVLKAPSTG